MFPGADFCGFWICHRKIKFRIQRKSINLFRVQPSDAYTIPPGGGADGRVLKDKTVVDTGPQI